MTAHVSTDIFRRATILSILRILRVARGSTILGNTHVHIHDLVLLLTSFDVEFCQVHAGHDIRCVVFPIRDMRVYGVKQKYCIHLYLELYTCHCLLFAHIGPSFHFAYVYPSNGNAARLRQKTVRMWPNPFISPSESV